MQARNRPLLRSTIVKSLAAAALLLPALPAAAAERGLASWYGPGYVGNRTASGEVFTSYKLTAAHRTLPFGTRVRVVNTATGAATVVTINDRGPFIRGRVIDLSEAAARAVGVYRAGLAPVELQVLAR